MPSGFLWLFRANLFRGEADDVSIHEAKLITSGSSSCGDWSRCVCASVGKFCPMPASRFRSVRTDRWTSGRLDVIGRIIVNLQSHMHCQCGSSLVPHTYERGKEFHLECERARRRLNECVATVAQKRASCAGIVVSRCPLFV